MKPSISCWRIRSSKTSPSRVALQFALSGPTAPTPCRSCLRIPIGLPGTSGASVRVIVSSHLARRADRQKELLEVAEPYDLIILDEAHHARRRGAGSTSESGPNALLKLMRVLKERTQGLVLLTATPMQVHPVEVFDLLSLLGLPPSGPSNPSCVSLTRFYWKARATRHSTASQAGTVTLPREERDISRPLGMSGRCDRGPPRGHRRSAKRAVRLG